MPPEVYAPGSPADWLRHAYSDLALAGVTPLPQVLLEQLCFHAQQAAEKPLKPSWWHATLPFLALTTSERSSIFCLSMFSCRLTFRWRRG